jgi:hypothetical protein
MPLGIANFHPPRMAFRCFIMLVALHYLAYTLRVADLQGPTGGLNGTTFLNAATVFDDAISNVPTDRAALTGS